MVRHLVQPARIEDIAVAGGRDKDIFIAVSHIGGGVELFQESRINIRQLDRVKAQRRQHLRHILRRLPRIAQMGGEDGTGIVGAALVVEGHTDRRLGRILPDKTLFVDKRPQEFAKDQRGIQVGANDALQSFFLLGQGFQRLLDPDIEVLGPVEKVAVQVIKTDGHTHVARGVCSLQLQGICLLLHGGELHMTVERPDAGGILPTAGHLGKIYIHELIDIEPRQVLARQLHIFQVIDLPRRDVVRLQDHLLLQIVGVFF